MTKALSCLLAAVFAFVTSSGHAADRAYWVWHRIKPLTEGERAELARQEVRTLYWNIGELENRAGEWRWKTEPQTLGAMPLRIVPVVRLASFVQHPFAPASMPALLEKLRAVAGTSGELQLDFDCPDRLLADYAAALREMRRVIPALSITALAHWPRLAGFAALAAAAGEMAPMFYDLQRDPDRVSANAPPPPILDPAQVAEALRLWSRCPIPWRAGLPTFARLTIFDRSGASRGQIPNWAWEDFCFHKSLHTLAPTRLGVTLFRADEDTRVAATPVEKDELVASRFTERTALAQSIDAAQAAGAAGIILFRLPDETDPAGWSLVDVGAIASLAKPHLILRAGGDFLELTNDSTFDLAPRLAGEKSDRDRGYALEIDAPAPLFREALPGDFWRVNGHAHPDEKSPIRVMIPLATRLTFWFSHLRAGASLRTGLLQFAPAASLTSVRYRILNCEGASAWKPLAPAPAP